MSHRIPVVQVQRFVRKLRGGAQPHLLEADDGCWYVVKFLDNPQHRRILVNELISSVLLDHMKIAASEMALVHLLAEFLTANPQIDIMLRSSRRRVEPGWHFGSRWPGDPAHLNTYDFLPDALLPQVVNLADFRAIVVFEKWVGNSDGRKSVFRALVRQSERAGGARSGFVARMIDHGFAFNGPHWEFTDVPLRGLYARRLVYEAGQSVDDLEPWLEQVVPLPEEVIDQARKRIPAEWIVGEEDALVQLLERLFERRSKVPELITACRTASSNPFPNWN